MKCLFCGSEYEDVDLRQCPNCGKKFIQRSLKKARENSERETKREKEIEDCIEKENVEHLKPVKVNPWTNCPHCRRTIPKDAPICPSCGGTIFDIDERYPAMQSPAERRRSETYSPIIGGVLLLIVGIPGIIVAFLMMAASPLYQSIGLSMGVPGVGSMFFGLGVAGLFLSLGVVAGGYFAFIRSHFVLTILGAVVALFIGLASPFFVGALMGLIALIFVAMSKDEFE